MVKSQPRTNDASAGGLKNGNIDGRVFKHQLGRDRPCVVTLDDLLIADICSVRGRITHGPAAVSEDMRYKPSRCRFAVCSGDGNDWYPCLGTRREQHRNDVLGDVSANSLAR